MNRKFPQVYLDIAIGNNPAGRIVFELFSDLTPKTCENFRGLCTGEYGQVGLESKTKKLYYLNSQFHRIIDGFVIQGGDITNGDGRGGHSIYGQTFNDENFERRHACAGLLSMANRGRNTNSSQFFITLKACPHLNGKHVVFGQVIEGMQVVRQIAKTPVDVNDRPKMKIVVVDCGEVDDPRDFFRYDPFKKEIFQQMQEQKIQIQKRIKDEEDRAANYLKHKRDIELQIQNATIKKQEKIETKKIQAIQQNHEQVQDQQIDQQPVLEQIDVPELEDTQQKRLYMLKLKINEARNMNEQARQAEEKEQKSEQYQKEQKRKQQNERSSQVEFQLHKRGLRKDQHFMNETAQKQELQMQKKVKKNTFGWDVFNEDSLYRAYKKKCSTIPFDDASYEQQMKENPKVEQINERLLDNMVNQLEKDKEQRKQFSRRRGVYEDEDVTYINERNRVFNKKLDRYYSQYSSQVKNNLERGTAQ